MPSYDITKMVPIEARAGSVVLLDGSLIHMRCVPEPEIVFTASLNRVLGTDFNIDLCGSRNRN
jgi:hypothetical protein